MAHDDEMPVLLTTAEVCAIFRVGRNTITRWADAGLLPSIMTPGGTRRYREADIRALLKSDPEP
jgi:excisionase family DNA binding protein